MKNSYTKIYEANGTDALWTAVGERLDWIKKWDRLRETSFDLPVKIGWYLGGKLNLSANCLDRHLAQRGDQIAILWEPDNPQEASREITYKELHGEVCRFANLLKSRGIGKGDFVTIYMPMIPEAAVAMLACARIGAPHSVVFGGFSAEALADRVSNCRSKTIITCDEGRRAGKPVPLYANVVKSLAHAPSVENIFVWNTRGTPHNYAPQRDILCREAVASMSEQCPIEIMDAEDPLFLLYTSGSTNKPKGILHTTGGYLAYASYTHAEIFQIQAGDVYWCTADVGWVTGHSYLVYGPLANGATTLMFEGVPSYPDFSRFWQIVDKYKVNIFYTAPTAIRALMREGDHWLSKSSRKSLRLLGSVGEPINPEAWNWYHKIVGEGRCPIVDTWWQTETGGILISPIPGKTSLKPGSATQPLPGIQAQLVDDQGKVLEGSISGNLCLTDSWPGQARTIYGDHGRFEQTYFATYPGKYFTGDGARRDEDGYYWITGRVDDVLNVSGHRLGTAEIESALVAHAQVAEAAVVGCPHEIKGQGIYAFVTLKAGVAHTEELNKELKLWVRQEIGAIASPDIIQWAPFLPKTRSGKIMRRILRKIAEGVFDNFGDTSTLADPQVVEDLVKGAINPTT